MKNLSQTKFLKFNKLKLSSCNYLLFSLSFCLSHSKNLNQWWELSLNPKNNFGKLCLWQIFENNFVILTILTQFTPPFSALGVSFFRSLVAAIMQFKFSQQHITINSQTQQFGSYLTVGEWQQRNIFCEWKESEEEDRKMIM